MGIGRVVIWGAVQGITEFIPVSSSGHLVIIPRLFGIKAPDLIFNIALHLGTLLAVIIFFRKDLTDLFNKEKRQGKLILLATLPILFCGLFLTKGIKPFFEDPNAVGWICILNGCILLAGHLSLKRSNGAPGKGVTPRQAFTIGLVQCFALLPGISRSGATITTGIFAGMSREKAYRFSFLLFVPTMLLAFLYSLREAGGLSFNMETFIGALVSMGFGLLALRLLYILIKKAQLYILGLYCVALGVMTVYIF